MEKPVSKDIRVGQIWILITGERVSVQQVNIEGHGYTVRFAGDVGTNYIGYHWFDYKIGG